MNYFNINKTLIVKSIEELQFEEVLNVEAIENNAYILKVNQDTEYRFSGKFGIWNNIQIEALSFKKYIKNVEVENYTASSFFKEIQKTCDMDDATLAMFIEEANQTIYADHLYIEKKNKTGADKVAARNADAVKPDSNNPDDEQASALKALPGGPASAKPGAASAVILHPSGKGQA